MSDIEDPLETALYPALEQHIREEFPNPNREGCPIHSFLVKAATSPASLNSEENALIVTHIPKCWPCFQELKNLRKTQQPPKRSEK